MTYILLNQHTIFFLKYQSIYHHRIHDVFVMMFPIKTNFFVGKKKRSEGHCSLTPNKDIWSATEVYDEELCGDA
jgi:hypothetical protein